MNIENRCEIKDFRIVESGNRKMLVAEGTAQSDVGSIHIIAAMNGKEFDTHAYVMPIGYAKRNVTHTFELQWPMPEAPENELKLILKDYVSNPVEIVACSQEDIEKITVKTSLVDHLIGISFDDQHIGMILGWAFSMQKAQVNYQVVDETGTPVRMSLRRTKLQRLIDRKAVTQEESLCGYIIFFQGAENHTYTLKMTDGISEDETLLVEDHTETKMDLNKFRSLMHQVNKKNVIRGIQYLNKYGVVDFFKRLKYGMPEGTDYDAWFRRIRITPDELKEQAEHKFAYEPKISIIVPTFNTPADFLHEMIQSVLNQSYANWQLCIADGSDENNPARKIIEEYAAKDDRIKITYLKENYGISGNTNKALDLADGEYTGLFDHDDLLEADALYEIVKSLQEKHHDIIYTDEDKLDNETKKFESPNFKPDYNADLLQSHNYITHFFVVKTAIIKGVGGFDGRYDGSQDYDVMLKCIERASDVHHVAKCLYHWRMHSLSTAMNPESKMYCYIAGQNALLAHLKRIGVKATIEMMPKPLFGEYHTTYEVPNELVSVIIPNKDHTDILKTCLDSLYKVNRYRKIEIIIVENNSTDPKTFKYYQDIQSRHSEIKVVTWQGKEFNYSSINNFGVQQAKGKYLLFLNNDTEMIKPDAIKEMLGLCAREDVGAVGAKLLYADNSIQHGGVIIGFSGYAGHVFSELPNGKYYGYMTRDMMNEDLCAVTAACMMTKRDVFEAVHGFDESFKVACNDIDYCLKVRASGKNVVYNAFSLWHHYESKSRGYENSFDKIERFDQEVERWQKKWMPLLIEGDPYYNPNFKIEDGPFVMK